MAMINGHKWPIRMASLAIMAIIMAINGNANGHKLQNDNGHKCPLIMAIMAIIMAIINGHKWQC